MADPALPLNSQLLDVESLVAEHGPVLYRYAYRLTGLAADAEDLTQQVFLTALAKLDQLREPTAARAWLFSVLRRAFLRQQRKPRPQPAANFDMNVDLLAVELPDDLARFHLPAGVQHRLDMLLDKQDQGQSLTADERQEAEGLVNLAELLSLLKLRSERLASA